MSQGGGEVIKYLLPNWEIINKDGVFAQKVYIRTVPDRFEGSFKEDTIFQLLHTPSY